MSVPSKPAWLDIALGKLEGAIISDKYGVEGSEDISRSLDDLMITINRNFKEAIGQSGNPRKRSNERNKFIEEAQARWKSF